MSRSPEIVEPTIEEPATEARPLKHSSARNTLNIFTARLATLPLTVINSILVARTLGPTDRGIYGFLMLFSAFAMPVLMFGFGASVTYFVSSKRYAARDIFLTALTVGILQGAAGAALLGALWHFQFLGETAHATSASLIVPMLLVLPLQGAILMSSRVALGDSWFALHNRMTIATALLTVVMLFSVVVVARLGVQGAVYGTVVNNFLLLSGILIASVRRYRPAWRLNFGFVRAGWRYGLKSWVADLAVQTNLRMDQWVLGMAAAPDVLGIYGPAVVISEMLWMLPDSMAHVLFNKIAGARDKSEQILLIERLHRIVFWTMSMAGVAMALAAPLVVLLVYGSAYQATALPLALLMPGTVALSVCKVLTKYFGGTGSPQHSGTAAAAGAISGLVFYTVLIPIYGAVGAAIASSACYTVVGLVSVVIYRKLVSPHRTRLFRPSTGDVTWLEQQVRLLRGQHPAGS